MAEVALMQRQTTTDWSLRATERRKAAQGARRGEASLPGARFGDRVCLTGTSGLQTQEPVAGWRLRRALCFSSIALMDYRS